MNAPLPSSVASRAPRVWPAVVGIVALTVAAYLNSFGGPFVFDDLPSILENPSIRRLSALGEVLFPSQAGGLTTSGRPLVSLSFALNHALGGYAVAGYHAVNLAIHLAAALCLFGLVRRTWRLAGAPAAKALPVAASVALLWSVHPLPTAAVTYLVQRAESLVALCYLLTLYAFARATADETTAGRRARWLAVSIAACALGMTAKEVMVSAPLIVLLYDRTFVAGSFAGAWRARRGFYLALGATWLVLAALLLGTGSRGGTAGFQGEVSAWAYALTQCRALVRYLALALWPDELVFDYGLGTVRSFGDVWMQALVIAGLLSATVVALIRRPVAGFIGAAFFAILAPSSSVVPIVTQTMAEHRMYLPLALVVTVVVLAGFRWLGRVALPASVAAALGLALTTAARNHDYRSEIALWQDTARKYPGNARAHNNLGQALQRAGRLDAALASYRRALALQPRYPETHYNLGAALAGRGEWAAAIGHYETALGIEPDYPEALNNLGNALAQTGRLEAAVARYEEAIRRRPSFPEAHNNLGNALLQAGRAAEARTRFERALALRPAYAEALYNLGNALAAAGDMPGALARYEAALAADTRYAAAHVNAGNALLELRRPAEALRHYEQAAAIDPLLFDAHFNRGSVLLELERAREAVPALEAAARLRPEHADALRALGFALAHSGQAAAAVPVYERYLALRPSDAVAREELASLRGAPAR